MDLSGNMTRQVEADMAVDGDASHVANVGRLVEDMELKMRNLLRMFFILNLSRPYFMIYNLFFYLLIFGIWLQRRSTLEKRRILFPI